MLFVILGSDRALASQALERQIELLDPTKLAVDRLDASASSIDVIYAAVTAAPFFGEQRIVVLNGLLSQLAAKGGRGAKSRGDTDVSKLVEAIPATNTLILFEPELADLGTSAKKQLPTDVSISINEAPRGSALIDLARRLASDHGSSLDNATARQVLDRLFPAYWPQAPVNRAFDKPPSVEQLTSEIAKLALASFPGPISSDVVADMISQRSEERIFPLLDAVVSGNVRASVNEVDNALRAGEEPSRTMAQIYQQIELAVAATAKGRPSDPVQTGRALGLSNANRMRPVTQAAQRASIAPARQLRFALENDRKLKTGRLRGPEDAIVDLAVGVTNATENR